MTSINIEKGVPIPERKFNFSSRESKYPLEHMEPGDSFRLPYDRRIAVRSAVSNRRKKAADERYVTRTEVRGRGRFVRVWRTK